LDKVEIENGYYEGYRFLPVFYLEFDYNNEDKVYDYINESYLHEQIFINELNSCDEYDSVILDFLSDGVMIKETPEPLSEEHIKQIEEYFNKVDEVLNKYLTPYTVGWCASEVVDD